MDNSNLIIRQLKSPIRRHYVQRETLVGLGLGRIGRVAVLRDNPEVRGMIEKVRHLVRLEVPAANELMPLSKLRFDALAAYTRQPHTVILFEEIEWHATADERVIGILIRDRIDDDFGWIVLGRDERQRFRAIDVGSSLATAAQARIELLSKLREHQAEPDDLFHQGDAPGPAIDFFTPIAPQLALHRTFTTLAAGLRFSPARGLIEAMMRYYQDADGNFVEQFQTTAFDARIWKLYLFAVFTELGFALASDDAVPDFIFSGPKGAFGLEATSANPPQGGDPKALPNGRKELNAYIENYIPMKLSQVLRRKLDRNPPYWNEPGMEDLPFVIAVQDFHSPGSMRMIVSAMTEYVFGIRHTMSKEGIRIEKIDEHVWGNGRVPSGFFDFDNAEHVSAVIINPQGTLPKFNRIGYLAGFGDRRVRMIRTGVRRGEREIKNPMPRPFRQIVHATGYSESWVEGMVVLHNPNAFRPLDPTMIPGAAHEFLQPDGRIVSLLPDFHPLFSSTLITVPDRLAC